MENNNTWIVVLVVILSLLLLFSGFGMMGYGGYGGMGGMMNWMFGTGFGFMWMFGWLSRYKVQGEENKMVVETNFEGKIVYKCEKCGWLYRKKEIAEKCEKW